MLLTEQYYFYLNDYSKRLFQMLGQGMRGNGRFTLQIKTNPNLEKVYRNSSGLMSDMTCNKSKEYFGITASFSDPPSN